jgi:hypothetical protein
MTDARMLYVGILADFSSLLFFSRNAYFLAQPDAKESGCEVTVPARGKKTGTSLKHHCDLSARSTHIWHFYEVDAHYEFTTQRMGSRPSKQGTRENGNEFEASL